MPPETLISYPDREGRHVSRICSKICSPSSLSTNRTSTSASAISATTLRAVPPRTVPTFTVMPRSFSFSCVEPGNLAGHFVDGAQTVLGRGARVGRLALHPNVDVRDAFRPVVTKSSPRVGSNTKAALHRRASAG